MHTFAYKYREIAYISYKVYIAQCFAHFTVQSAQTMHTRVLAASRRAYVQLRDPGRIRSASNC